MVLLSNNGLIKSQWNLNHFYSPKKKKFNARLIHIAMKLIAPCSS